MCARDESPRPSPSTILPPENCCTPAAADAVTDGCRVIGFRHQHPTSAGTCVRQAIVNATYESPITHCESAMSIAVPAVGFGARRVVGDGARRGLPDPPELESHVSCRLPAREHQQRLHVRVRRGPLHRCRVRRSSAAVSAPRPGAACVLVSGSPPNRNGARGEDRGRPVLALMPLESSVRLDLWVGQQFVVGAYEPGQNAALLQRRHQLASRSFHELLLEEVAQLRQRWPRVRCDRGKRGSPTRSSRSSTAQTEIQSRS